jgi:glycine/D-amino acid oxidase-like deaminating enzyme
VPDTVQGAGSSGSAAHDVRPMHGGDSFYGFPSFGSKPGESCRHVQQQDRCCPMLRLTPAVACPPPPPRASGLKIGKFSVSEACDPDSLDRRQRPSDLAPLQAAVAAYMPGAAGPVLDFAACMFVMTPDGHFVIDQHPRHPQVRPVAVGARGERARAACALT